MYKIRQINYSANSVSIQVYKIENRKRIIIKHVGTAHNEQERNNLLSLANDFIENASKPRLSEQGGGDILQDAFLQQKVTIKRCPRFDF
jgi:hypothetical protein